MGKRANCSGRVGGEEVNDLFDKERFGQLIEKAIGTRTITEYSISCGINLTYVSKYVNRKLPKPPSVQVIRKMATKAQNGVTYREFMDAAGYLDGIFTKGGEKNVY